MQLSGNGSTTSRELSEDTSEPDSALVREEEEEDTEEEEKSGGEDIVREVGEDTTEEEDTDPDLSFIFDGDFRIIEYPFIFDLVY